MSAEPALAVIEEQGVRIVEGTLDARIVARVEEASRVVEACLSHRTLRALLYTQNLPDRFFDLSSGDAGAILQKLRNYRIRLAIVCPPGSVQFSSRFGELMAEEQLRRDVRVFESRGPALDWLAKLQI